MLKKPNKPKKPMVFLIKKNVNKIEPKKPIQKNRPTLYTVNLDIPANMESAP